MLARALGALLVAGPVPVVPATIPVGGACDLAEAIENANADATVNPDCASGSGADTLQLSGNVTLTTVDNSIDGDNGLPSITSEITIEGGGFIVERGGGAPDFRILHVASDGDLTLENITVRGGRLTGTDASGGGIFNTGSLMLANSTVSGNSLSLSGSGYGGGISSLGTTMLVSSTVSGNQIDASFAYGGGISSGNYLDRSAVLNAEISQITGNSATGFYVAGAGIDAWGLATLTESTISDNDAVVEGNRSVAYGVGINLGSGNLTLSRSTVSGNSGYSDASATYLFGGGVAMQDGILNVSSSTVSTNSLTAAGAYGVAYGGGIEHLTNGGTLSYSTVSGNSVAANYMGGGGIVVGFGDALNLIGTLVANSTGGNCDGLGTLNDIQNNLTDDDTCGTISNSLDGVDPLLLDNGGPTRTHALLEGSSAIDNAGACTIATDQRGVDRDDPDGCDSGAYELAGCLAPDGYSETAPELVTTEITIEVCRTIDTGESLTVAAPGGVLILRAGAMVSLGNGTVIEDGAELEVEIDPNLGM